MISHDPITISWISYQSKNAGPVVSCLINTSKYVVQSTYIYHKHPCGVISGPCFVQKSWFRTAQAIQNSRKMCSKNQWISDVKVLKTCVLAHSVCICWLSGFVSWAWRTHNSLVKTNVLRRRVYFASPAIGFCFGGVIFSVLSERIFVQSFACSSEQVSVTRQPSPLPLPDVY